MTWVGYAAAAQAATAMRCMPIHRRRPIHPSMSAEAQRRCVLMASLLHQMPQRPTHGTKLGCVSACVCGGGGQFALQLWADGLEAALAS